MSDWEKSGKMMDVGQRNERANFNRSKQLRAIHSFTHSLIHSLDNKANSAAAWLRV